MANRPCIRRHCCSRGVRLKASIIDKVRAITYERFYNSHTWRPEFYARIFWIFMRRYDKSGVFIIIQNKRYLSASFASLSVVDIISKYFQTSRGAEYIFLPPPLFFLLTAFNVGQRGAIQDFQDTSMHHLHKGMLWKSDQGAPRRCSRSISHTATVHLSPREDSPLVTAARSGFYITSRWPGAFLPSCHPES